MVLCAIFGCKSNNNKKLKRNQSENCGKLKFFKLPKDKIHEKMLINKCGRKDKINGKYNAVSLHFSPECYYHNLKHELLNYSPKSNRKLKPGAIPTENVPEMHHKGREYRQKTREPKKMLRELLENTNSEDIVSDTSKMPEPSIVQTPQTATEKSTITEDEYERFEKVALRTHILKTENDAKNKIFTQG